MTLQVLPSLQLASNCSCIATSHCLSHPSLPLSARISRCFCCPFDFCCLLALPCRRARHRHQDAPGGPVRDGSALGARPAVRHKRRRRGACHPGVPAPAACQPAATSGQHIVSAGLHWVSVSHSRGVRTAERQVPGQFPCVSGLKGPSHLNISFELR